MLNFDAVTSGRTDHKERASGRDSLARGRPPILGVAISNPDRVLYPEIGVTKLELAEFAARISEWTLPHVAGRPLTLVRCEKDVPSGCSYMRHSRVWGPKPLRHISIQEKTKLGQYLIADSAAALVALVQMDVLEVHTWNSVERDIEHPDRLVFDLDPGPAVTFTEVVGAAQRLRRFLQELELESFVKTTGGSGLHVVVPLAPEHDWSTCLRFARSAGEVFATSDPRSLTTSLPKANRTDKILIDYLRNNRANTSVAAFSVRARRGAPVSVPVSWEELGRGLDPLAFTVRSVPKRLAAQKRDPWQRYWKLRQRLPQSFIADAAVH